MSLAKATCTHCERAEQASLGTLTNQVGKSVVILLCGGDKRSQPADIKQAKALWMEWKRRQA